MVDPSQTFKPANTHSWMLATQEQTLPNVTTSGRTCITRGATTMRTDGWTIPAYHGTSVIQVHLKMMRTINLLQVPTNKINSLPPHRAMMRNLTKTWMKEATLNNPRTAISLRALEMLRWTTILLNK